MKNIKQFKYKNTYNFDRFLKDYGYKLEDVKGFNVSFKCWFKGNFLKTYIIYLKDNECLCFKVVYFKSLNESNQSRLGFNGETLLIWYQDANVVWYKVKVICGMDDKYVIAF